MLKARMNAAIAASAFAVVVATPSGAQNLLVNGNFEASNSSTQTPTGWTNVGHSEGVISYATFGTPAYDGDYFYDLGGYGNANGPAGDGIEQTVSTVVGSLYTLNFGLSSENSGGITVLQVYFNDVLDSSFTQTTSSQGLFRKPFVTQSLTYVATSTLTKISFIQGAGTGNGFNDPLIDGVIFQRLAGGGVPEPATWALMIFGMGAIGGAMRRRNAGKTTVRFA